MSYLGYNQLSRASSATLVDKGYYQAGTQTYRIGIEVHAYETGRVSSILAFVRSASGNIYFSKLRYFINLKDGTASGSHTEIGRIELSGNCVIPLNGNWVGCGSPNFSVTSGNDYIISIDGKPETLWSSAVAINLGKFTGSTSYPAYRETSTYDSPESPWVCSGSNRLLTDKYCIYAYISPESPNFPYYSGSKMKMYKSPIVGSGQSALRVYSV